jgi:hypothetical protein
MFKKKAPDDTGAFPFIEFRFVQYLPTSEPLNL